MSKSTIERLIKTNPDMEIWWDSSPLVFEKWVQEMLAAADPADRDELEDQLRRLYNAEDPAKSIFRGCTTNPPLSLTAVQSDPEFWDAWVDDLARSNPDLDVRELFNLTYEEVIKRGAEMYLPIYEASNHRYGWISGQLDPRLLTEVDEMVAQAERISALSPNVMIKVPGSMEGIETLRILTAKGISTNVTTCFMLPQIMAAANAVQKGFAEAEASGLDMSNWRSVITMMIGRLIERKAVVEQAARRGIDFTWQDRHWFGIAVFRRAYRMLTEGGYHSKLLACSLRPGPTVAGKPRFWDVQKIAGGDIVYTLPPYVLTPLFGMGDNLHYRSEIEEPIPQDVMDKMMKIPYCIQTYDPNGLALEQFNSHPATVYTANSFSKASSGLEEYVGKRVALVRK
ncbi:MAG: transaldolase [Anaerolineae bacterium]|nr:transaldolase [Anaerolineae bacterium]